MLLKFVESGHAPTILVSTVKSMYTSIMYAHAHDSQHILCTHLCFTLLFLMDTLPIKGIVGAQLFCDFQTD